MLTQGKFIFTPVQYLTQERLANTRSEYIDGEIFAMAGASRAHNQISSNLVLSLGNQLFDKPCSVYASDMKVNIATNYVYPDVLVTCEKEQFADDHTEILLNPLIIIEILSDTTEAYDRGIKFLNYQFIASLKIYLLVAQKSCHVEKFIRQNNQQWLYTCFHQLDDNIELETIQCQLPLKEIYRKVQL